MKIQVKSADRTITVPIPTVLLFSKASAWTWLKLARISAGKYVPDSVRSGMDTLLGNLSEEAVYALCREMMAIKQRYGTWDLVEVKSTDGSEVLIQL